MARVRSIPLNEAAVTNAKLPFDGTGSGAVSVLVELSVQISGGLVFNRH